MIQSEKLRLQRNPTLRSFGIRRLAGPSPRACRAAEGRIALCGELACSRFKCEFGNFAGPGHLDRFRRQSKGLWSSLSQKKVVLYHHQDNERLEGGSQSVANSRKTVHSSSQIQDKKEKW